VLGLVDRLRLLQPHLGLKHLPQKDLSGLKLEFDIEYDQALDGAMRFDAAKFPSPSRKTTEFVPFAGAHVHRHSAQSIRCGIATAPPIA
jgi:hypothetical protein